jgi:hypothetical protein
MLHAPYLSFPKQMSLAAWLHLADADTRTYNVPAGCFSEAEQGISCWLLALSSRLILIETKRSQLDGWDGWMGWDKLSYVSQLSFTLFSIKAATLLLFNPA